MKFSCRVLLFWLLLNDKTKSMNKNLIKNHWLVVAASGLLIGLGSCSSGYSVVSVEGGRFPMTEAYDVNPDARAEAILAPYKRQVDSIMSPVIGHSAATLTSQRPESPLSNLISDVLRRSASSIIGGEADVAVMNMGGIRNALPEGVVTFGTIYEIAPFENALCVLTMDGKTLIRLFEQIAAVHGEGLSGARLVITSDGKLVDAKVGGKSVDPRKDYTVATIDYLAEGNDKMPAFRDAKSKTFPKDKVLRDLLIDYVKQCEEKGQFVTARTEGRIKVSED